MRKYRSAKTFQKMYILSVEEIIKKAKKTHKDKYDYSKTKPGNMQSKIIIHRESIYFESDI